MSWRHHLRPASFRGVPFEVDSGSAKFGRRNVEHEYPQRDVGHVEDLGRGLRRFAVVGFVLGDNWQSKRDALIEACERGGPGRLVHPTFGAMEVACDGIEIEESSDAGRSARFTLTMIEAGELRFPTAEASSSGAVTTAATDADASTVADFESGFTVDGQPPFVIAEALAEVTAVLNETREAIGGIGSDTIADAAALAIALDNLEAAAEGLLEAPGELAEAMIDALAGIGVLAVLEALTAAAGTIEAGTGGTPTEQVILDNAAALRRMTIRAGLAAAARVVAGTTFASYNDAVAARDTLAAGLAGEAEQAEDDAFAALTDLRLAVVEDVELRAAELARLRDLAVVGVSSTLELACDLYLDGTREAEIEARNLPPHPGFVAGVVVVADE